MLSTVPASSPAHLSLCALHSSSGQTVVINTIPHGLSCTSAVHFVNPSTRDVEPAVPCISLVVYASRGEHVLDGQVRATCLTGVSTKLAELSRGLRLLPCQLRVV